MARTAQDVLDSYAEKTPQESAEDKILAIEAAANRSATVPAIVLGVIGALMLGGGMSIVMELEQFFAFGIVLGVAGIAVVALAYPLYKKRLAAARAEAKPEIMRLAESLK